MKIDCYQKSVCIRSERTEIEFCRKNGCIVEIRDSRGGKKICSVKGHSGLERLFRVIAKKGRYRCFCSESFMQTDVFWEFEERSVKIIYKDLTFEGEPTSCSAEVLISEAEGDEFLFSLKIVNEAPMQIHEVQFPVCRDFPIKKENLLSKLLPAQSGNGVWAGCLYSENLLIANNINKFQPDIRERICIFRGRIFLKGKADFP